MTERVQGFRTGGPWGLHVPGGGGGGGGPGWFLDGFWVDGANTDPGADGSMLNPYPTIQQAVDAAAAAQDAMPVGHANPQERAQTRQQILVASGFYDEDINILRGNTFLEFLALGPVTLGDGAASKDFASTTPRNVTWVNDQAQEDADAGAVNQNRRPQLMFSCYHDQSGDASSTHIQIASAWDISGDLILHNPGGGGGSTTAEMHLNNVRLRGVLNPTTDAGIRNCYFRGCRFNGQIMPSGSAGLFLQIAERCAFDGVAPAAHTMLVYNRMWMCNIAGDMTFVNGLVTAWNGVPPPGCYACIFGDWDMGTPITFTSPNFLALDGSSNYWFKTLACVLAGGAVKTILDDLVP